MGLFFTSDLHFGHKNVIKYCNRPFASVEEMDESIIENWNKTVSKKDIVYVIGDFSFHRPEKTLEIFHRLNGHEIHLIAGNHDKRIKQAKAAFTSCENLKEIKLMDRDAYGEKQHIVLCHYPMITWNKSHYGSWMLHGHCHGSLKDDRTSLRLDVGVDVWNFTPISFDFIKSAMKLKKFEPVDHHGRDL